LTRNTILAVLLASVSLFVASSAESHEFDARHRAIVTIRHSPDVATTHDKATTRAEVILLMEIPKGRRAGLIRVQYDLDHNGRLNPAEALLLAGDLGSEAVGGYVLRQDNKPMKPVGIKSSGAFTEDGGIAVAVLLDYKLTTVMTKPSKIKVEVLETPGGGTPLRARPISVELQVMGAQVRSSSHPLATDVAVLGPVEILPGKPGAWVELVAGGRPVEKK